MSSDSSNLLDRELLEKINNLIDSYLPDEEYLELFPKQNKHDEEAYQFNFDKIYRNWYFFEQIRKLLTPKLVLALTSSEYIVREYAQLVMHADMSRKPKYPTKSAIFSIYPLTIIPDRYGGTYSGGSFLAFNCLPHEIPKECHSGGDIDSLNWYENNDKNETSPVIFGIGGTPELAANNLLTKLNIRY